MGQMIQGYACHENLVAQVRAQDGTERYLAVECLCGEPLVWHIDSALTSCSDMSLAQSTSINAALLIFRTYPAHYMRLLLPPLTHYPRSCTMQIMLYRLWMDLFMNQMTRPS